MASVHAKYDQSRVKCMSSDECMAQSLPRIPYLVLIDFSNMKEVDHNWNVHLLQWKLKHFRLRKTSKERPAHAILESRRRSFFDVDRRLA